MSVGVDDLVARRRAFAIALAEAGMRAGEAAAAAGIAKGTFSRIQNGVQGCRDETAERIARVLGRSRSELLL
jgi:plasmid maintenance system antidote protein VapI